ncbi:hypothetical protein BHE74_00046791 [Ensete ventricosum]|nr:hypothetical protein BHE74_00046791 [Ensete ventricosum]RZR97371.1 hypothetical protein BHM03_00026542 [Ensete ventricosum]
MEFSYSLLLVWFVTFIGYGKRLPGCPYKKACTEFAALDLYCLVDCDPYGFDILMVYRFGSMQMAYDANLLRVPEISWLGVFHSDLQKYHLPDRCLLKLTADGHLNILSCYFICLLQWK